MRRRRRNQRCLNYKKKKNVAEIDRRKSHPENSFWRPFVPRQRIPTDCFDFGQKTRSRKIYVAVLNMMDSRSLIVFSGFLIKMNLASFIHLDTSLDPELVNQKQVFINRKERFIKFDTKDNELEVELGISIPFIKVPLTASREMSDGKSESKVSVNAPGLIVAGMLMLTSFVIVPLLFTTTAENSFGFQRKGKRDLWSVVEGVNKALAKKGIDSSSCMQKSVCWIAKASNGGKDGSIGKWINYLTKTWWFNRLVGGTIIEEAMEGASDSTSCAAKYSHCSFTKKHLQSFVQMVASGHT